ncbi:nuclear transport factor 2 family protein [Mycolicibacterium sp. J2]|uniref:nuclear transport factor 2 family protein n=1 Tax=Mycolicibacterium sp. J2 TaxID=2993511 RepID=UPI00224B421D|nr:nuclear transport factor 2 family protein [Mycolicibacterium sp. J2]MCX2711340.1 nuclear transport factor 2 family protein [Mycolicibacterium sp. J2]
MSEQQDNIDLVTRGYEAFTKGDIDTVMALFDDNVEWVQPGNSTISGTYHGKGELGQYLARLAEKNVSVTLNRLVADGDTVVALTEVAVGDEKGSDADVFTIRDGKTARVQVYTDTALMERVYGSKQHATH